MIVFGDAVRMESPRAKLASLLTRLDRIEVSGIEAHAELVAAFVETAELAQGLADLRFLEDGRDQESRERSAAASLLQAFAEAIAKSWRGGLTVPPLEPILDALDLLAGFDLPPEIACRRAEGYAHYAVYPETYFEAAARLGPGRIGAVVGLRSIGIGLAAMVAAGARAPLPVSLRPMGHPYRRYLDLSEEIAAEITAGHSLGVAVVDEGPGLSGSSFGAVADLLEARGVDVARIHFFPSHAGEPGPQAEPRHLDRWRAAKRHVVTFDELVLEAPDPVTGFAAWCQDLVGDIASIEDLSGGAWRSHLPLAERDWPPAHPQQERRKLLLSTMRSETWLARFAGLGAYGEGKLERGQALAEAGFVPETVGMRHGFILQRWHQQSEPLAAGEEEAMETVANYLAFRVRRFATTLPGASLEALASMLLHNAEEALGADAALAFASWPARALDLQDEVRPVATDNRLHRWEWLRAEDGRILKGDAFDHCEAHDLVGCQDIAYDVVGAVIEFGWYGAERREFLRHFEGHSRNALNPGLLAFYLPCYVAFQLGSFTMACDSVPENSPDRARLDDEADRYATALLEVAGRL
jgi:hypothetical protein